MTSAEQLEEILYEVYEQGFNDGWDDTPSHALTIAKASKALRALINREMEAPLCEMAEQMAEDAKSTGSDYLAGKSDALY